jgi:hypothetical protein
MGVYLKPSESPKFSRDFSKKTSAFSASSLFLLLLLCAEDYEQERACFPKGEKNPKPQRSGRTRRGRNRKTIIPVLRFLKRRLCGLCAL